MKAILLDENGIIRNIVIVDALNDVPNCLFMSDVSTLNIGDVYDQQLAEMGYLPNSKHPYINLNNVDVSAENITRGNGGIWWLPINEQFTLTANAQLQNMEMMIIIERVVSNNVIDDLRAKASIVDGLITINSKFTQSGNYQITSERLNAGLEAVDAPFRLAFDKVEFDAYV